MLVQGQRCPRCQCDVPASSSGTNRCTACGADLSGAGILASWFVARGKTKQGPFSLAALQELIRNKQLTPDDMLLQEGMRVWAPARSIAGLFDSPASQPTVDVPPSAPQETAADALQTAPYTPNNTFHHSAGKAPVPSVPGFEIVSELGFGGMGVVYLARQTSLKRLVALKMIRAGAHAGPEDVARFHTEAEAVARLHHPHIVQIYEVGDYQGQPYCALEYIEGGSLARRLSRKPLPAQEAAELVEKLARAMSSAHQHQIVHRDLKPANVLLTPEGEPKITDFGLAKQLDADTGQTQSGAIMGTPSYMAPEQAAGKVHDIGPLADVYALGAILYECLTGRPPFKGEHLVDTLDMVLHQEPFPPSKHIPGIPRDLERICLKCLAKESSERYHSALALAQDIERFRAGEPILARPESFTRKLWRKARRHRVGLLIGLSAAVILTVAGMMAFRGSKAWRVSDLQESITSSLEREPADWTVEHVEAIEAEIVQLAELAPERAESARASLLDRWRKVLLQTIEQTRLTSEEVKRLEVHLTALASRDQTVADEVKRRFRMRVRDWETVVEMKPPYTDFRRMFTSTEIQKQDNGLHFKPAAGLPAADLSQPVLTQFTCQGNTQLEAVFEGSLGKKKSLGLMLDSPQRHTTFIMALAFSPDDRLLASGGHDGTVYLWDVSRGTTAVTMRVGKPVTAVAFTLDGNRLLIAAGNEVGIWDIKNGEAISTFIAHEGQVRSLALSPDGKLLATGGTDKLIKLWNTSEWSETARMIGHMEQVNHVVFSTDGTHLASASNDKTARIWNMETHMAEGDPIAHPDVVLRVAFSPDDKTLALAGHPLVKLWSLTEKRERVTILMGSGEVQFVSQGSELVLASSVWDVSGLPRMTNWLGGRPWRMATGVALSNNKKTVAVADWERFIDVCELNAETPTMTLSGGGYTFLITSVASENSLDEARPIQGEGKERELQILRNGVIQRSQAVTLPDGPLVLRGSRDGDRLEFQVNQLPPLVFHDAFPLSPSLGYYGVYWAPDVRLTHLHARRQAEPPFPSPLERGDALYFQGMFRDALSAYEEQVRVRGPAALEARYKAGLCLLRLSRADEAATQFERLSGESAERWPMLAACRLWLLRLEQKRMPDAEVVFDSIKARYRFEQLLPLLADESRRLILARYRESLGGASYLIAPPDMMERVERAWRVAAFLQPDVPDSWLAANFMIIAQQVGKPERALQFWNEHSQRIARMPRDQRLNAIGSALLHYCWMMRLRGEPQTALAELNRWLESVPVGDSIPKGSTISGFLFIERVRIHIALGDWTAAEKEIKECHRYLQAQGDRVDTYMFLHTHLIDGFLRERLGDLEGARKAWLGGRWKIWRDKIQKTSPYPPTPPGFREGGMFDLIGSSLGNDLSEAEAEQSLQSAMALMGESGPGQFASVLRISPMTMKTMWQSPRGKETARALVFRTVSYPDATRRAALLFIYEALRQGAFTGELSSEVDQLLWQLLEESFHLYYTNKVTQAQVLQIGLTWKGVSGVLGWGTVGPTLQPQIRGAVSFILGHRYLRLNKPDEAKQFFNTTVADLPADAPARKLALIELDRLYKK
jgi:serine/threonine protein kinase/tetratricopeptide (TPR) repeat protein